LYITVYQTLSHIGERGFLFGDEKYLLILNNRKFNYSGNDKYVYKGRITFQS